MVRNRISAEPRLLLLPGAAAFHFLIYYGARRLAAGLPHRCLAVGADALVPLVPWTILIYWGCYLFWIANYCIGTACDESRTGCRFLAAHYIGEAVCFLLFLLLPTTMSRPEPPLDTLFGRLTAFTYRCDAADNLFPSIHCFASWLCWIGVRGNRRIPVWYRAFSLLLAAAVCASTLTVRQHVIADIPAGIALAELSYLASGLLDRRCISIGGRRTAVPQTTKNEV